MTSESVYTTPLRIPADHPCLPGHFPGQPIVPAVVMLEAVALAIKAWRGERLVEITEAKFMAPLLPDEDAEVNLCEYESKLRFDIRRGGQVLARGTARAAI